jgi:VanZ family protein
MVPPRVSRFAPPILWMGVIAGLSSGFFGADETAGWILPVLARWLPGTEPAVLHALHAGLRKLAHLTEYGILAVLWLRAFGTRPRAAQWTVLLATLYAVVDEARQGLAPNRTPAVTDVLIDATGALLAVACLRPRTGPGLVGLRLARWVALGIAAGSLAAALVDWSLGLAAWDLVAAAVLALAGVLGLRRLERAWRGPT